MNTPEQSQLGKASAYIDQYDASLLFPIPRQGKRDEIGISGSLPFLGADMWTAFELSWLNQRGKPQLALAHFTVPCETPNIIESKSFKLYLNSFNMSRFDTTEAVREVLLRDLSAAVGLRVGVKLIQTELFDAQPFSRVVWREGRAHPDLVKTATSGASRCVSRVGMQALTSQVRCPNVPFTTSP